MKIILITTGVAFLLFFIVFQFGLVGVVERVEVSGEPVLHATTTQQSTQNTPVFPEHPDISNDIPLVPQENEEEMHEVMEVPEQETIVRAYTMPALPRAQGAYILHTGELLYGERVTTPFPIASITKLMSAVVVREYMQEDLEITVPESVLVYTSTPRLVAGEHMALSDLLLLMLTESSNESVLAVSGHVGLETFVGLMNMKAIEIGMQHTHFADSSGASEENVSTADDLLILAQYLLEKHPDILAMTKLHGEQGSFADLENYNHYEHDPQFIGGKTGKTRIAQETMLAIFVEEESRDGLVVYVVLGSANAKQSVDMLRNTTR
jgi:D-alanyl-D-alanine carboxypeptidase